MFKARKKSAKPIIYERHVKTIPRLTHSIARRRPVYPIQSFVMKMNTGNLGKTNKPIKQKNKKKSYRETQALMM
jgi:hypothetical protein